ncbi:MAG: hypothetical protein JWM35_672 [Verrucomicrobia bacterium]|nr:hypothetical protein [Verrucomicrobiota bacterium]
MNSTAKKSSRFDWRRPVVGLAAWVARRPYLVVIPLGLLPFLGLALRLDLSGIHHSSRRVAEDQAIRARDDARIARETAQVPEGGRLQLTFQNLSFVLPPEALDPLNHIRGYAAFLPAPLRRYDGREVRITGFMLPTEMEDGQVRSCLVLANQMSCCYGNSPRFCEFIVARMVGPPAASLMDRPIGFVGTLHVRDVFVDGFWTALYSMDCTAME